jgi:enamine deaminase RidA (YjgF/YER057c/UK114 family)
MRKRVVNPWRWQENYGFVQAWEVTGAKRILVCSGQASIDGDGNVVHAGDMGQQVNQCLDNIETVLAGAGLKLRDVVRMNYYTTDVDRFLQEGWAAVKGRMQEAGCRPASTLLGVTRLAYPELLIEIEATAASD